MSARTLFDIGGTWLRQRDVTEDGAAPMSRIPSPSILNAPDEPVGHLQQRLVDVLVERTASGAKAAVCLGAALNERTGIVYGSSPMWGDFHGSFALLDTLRELRPDVEWQVFNDVSCGLADFVSLHADQTEGSIGYLTVSSGIAFRSADVATRTIPVDARGLQGEVGHRTLVSESTDVCECGRRGHLAGTCSGPGLARRAKALGIPAWQQLPLVLPSLLHDGDERAWLLLETAVAPIAELLRLIWSLSPGMRRIGIGGGVVSGLNGFYERELLRQLATPTSYVDEALDAAEFHRRIVVDPAIDSLQGAALLAEGFLQIRDTERRYDLVH